jgi:hypothetical protein
MKPPAHLAWNTKKHDVVSRLNQQAAAKYDKIKNFYGANNLPARKSLVWYATIDTTTTPITSLINMTQPTVLTTTVTTPPMTNIMTNSTTNNIIAASFPGNIVQRGYGPRRDIYPLAPDTSCTPEEYAIDQIRRCLNDYGLTLDDVAASYNAVEYVKYSGINLPPGKYQLPGGAVLEINANSYHIDDSNHKTVYKAHTNRDFNEYVNTSDILEKFMGYIAGLQLTREQFMELPLRLFILWLIIEASKQDGEPPPEPEVKQLELALEPLQMNLAKQKVAV